MLMFNTFLEGREPLLNTLQLQAFVLICVMMFITIIIYCEKHKRDPTNKIWFLKVSQGSKD